MSITKGQTLATDVILVGSIQEKWKVTVLSIESVNTTTVQGTGWTVETVRMLTADGVRLTAMISGWELWTPKYNFLQSW